MKHVIGIGNALLDVLARIENEHLLQEMNLPKGSMQLLDEVRYREVSEVLETMNPQRATGGSACNTMLCLANLGAAPAVIGKVGNDANGKFFADNCTAVGIRPFLMTDKQSTGVASTFITPDGQRTFGTFLGAAACLEPDDVKAEWLEGYDFLYIEGYLVQNHALIRRVVELAKAAGLKICLDLASYNIVEADHDFFAELLAQTDIVFANEEESRAFTGKESREALADLAQLCEVAVVKIGKHGVLVQRGTEVAEAPAMEVKEVIDTTAAGDFFAGGFLYAFTQGASLKVCAETGGITAGHVIQVVGTKLPETTWDTIRREIKETMK